MKENGQISWAELQIIFTQKEHLSSEICKTLPHPGKD